MNTFRKATINTIVGEITETIEKLMQESESKSVKDRVLSSLTPYGYEAFKLAYQIIEFEYDSTKGESDWKEHFIKHHDFVISLLQQGDDTIFNYATVTFTVEHINEVFRQDTRSLEEIMDKVAELYIATSFELEMEDDECLCCSCDVNNDELHELLHHQLSEVVESLKELTKGDKGIKQFEIKLDNANFEIILND